MQASIHTILRFCRSINEKKKKLLKKSHKDKQRHSLLKPRKSNHLLKNLLLFLATTLPSSSKPRLLFLHSLPFLSSHPCRMVQRKAPDKPQSHSQLISQVFKSHCHAPPPSSNQQPAAVQVRRIHVLWSHHTPLAMFVLIDIVVWMVMEDMMSFCGFHWNNSSRTWAWRWEGWSQTSSDGWKENSWGVDDGSCSSTGCEQIGYCSEKQGQTSRWCIWDRKTIPQSMSYHQSMLSKDLSNGPIVTSGPLIYFKMAILVSKCLQIVTEMRLGLIY